jgi:predicted nucleic acid-binding Zn ribbon protein
LKKPTHTSRKAEVSPLKDAINELLDAYKLKGKLNQNNIIGSWEKLMGAPIAKRTTKIYFQEKKLFVKLNSAPLKQELNLSKSKIIKMLNEDSGEIIVEEIIFL